MKRLILMGGRPWLAGDEGEQFSATLFRYFPRQVKVAFCMFAQSEEQWEETRVWNANTLKRFRGERQLDLQTMTPDNFVEVSAWVDVIYIPGGDPLQLMETLKACGDIAKLWDGKVIAGSSAGADLFCEGFIWLQQKKFFQGMGWVKATCIPHWRAEGEGSHGYKKEDWDWAEAECLRQRPDLPVLCIQEGDFVEYSVT